MTKVKIDLIYLQKILTKFNYLLGYKLGIIFQSYLKEEKRDYPRTTVRQYGRGTTGKIANSPRDVVDSGNLVNSFIWRNLIKGNIYLNNFIWDTDYAILIYLGWTSSTGLPIPAYKWVHKALKDIDIDNLLTEIWREIA